VFELYRRRFVQNPEWWAVRTAWLAAATGRAAAAVEISKYLDSARAPLGQPINAYAYRGAALHQLGRYSEQLKLAGEIEERFPSEMLTKRATEAEALAALGEIDVLRRRIAEWEATPEPKPLSASVWSGTRGYIGGLELMAHGKAQQGLEMLRGTIPIYRRMRDSEGFRPEFVEVLVVTGQLAEARTVALSDLQRVTSAADSITLLTYLGVIAAREGKPGDATQYFDAAARYDRLESRGGRSLARTARDRAKRLAWMGDRQGAVRALEEARIYQPWLVSHHFTHREPAFASMRDYPPFQLFLKPRD
jgi:tetratricopeptide (TPR) repeat protein